MATKADTSGALKQWKQRESTLACNTFYRGKIVFVSNNIAFNQIRMKLVRNACCTFIMMKKKPAIDSLLYKQLLYIISWYDKVFELGSG